MTGSPLSIKTATIKIVELIGCSESTAKRLLYKKMARLGIKTFAAAKGSVRASFLKREDYNRIETVIKERKRYNVDIHNRAV